MQRKYNLGVSFLAARVFFIRRPPKLPLASFLCPFDVVLDSVVWAEVRPWPHFPLSWGRPGGVLHGRKAIQNPRKIHPESKNKSIATSK